MRTALLCLLLAACGAPTRPEYVARSWAKVPVEQAYEECNLAQQRNDDVSHETCMRSKGWFYK